jgi:hypothetical protein
VDASAPNDASSSGGGTSGAGGALGTGGEGNTGGALGSGGTGTGGALGSGGAGTGGKTGTGGAAGSGGKTGTGGTTGTGGATGSGGTTGTGGATGTGGQGNVPPYTPVYRIPVRIHVGMSNLTDPEILAALAEVNRIWLTQAGVCFEFEVTDSETNRTGGLDIRYLSGPIPGNPTANGVTQSAHAIYVIDHPTLYAAPNPTLNFTGRTTAHEIGHALGLSHENPPDDPTYNDCANPCICVVNNLDCDDFLMRSHRQGFFLSAPEITIARPNAKSKALADQTPLACSAPVFN